jgi:hypothetical protein
MLAALDEFDKSAIALKFADLTTASFRGRVV